MKIRLYQLGIVQYISKSRIRDENKVEHFFQPFLSYTFRTHSTDFLSEFFLRVRVRQGSKVSPILFKPLTFQFEQQPCPDQVNNISADDIWPLEGLSIFTHDKQVICKKSCTFIDRLSFSWSIFSEYANNTKLWRAPWLRTGIPVLLYLSTAIR